MSLLSFGYCTIIWSYKIDAVSSLPQIRCRTIYSHVMMSNVIFCRCSHMWSYRMIACTSDSM